MAISGDSSSSLASSKFSLRTLVTYSGANFIAQYSHSTHGLDGALRA